MGRAFIQQAALKWKDAGVNFDLVFSMIPDNVTHGLRAHEEGAWCKVQIDLHEEGLVDLQRVLDALNGLDDKRNSDRARCLWRIGKCYMLLTGPLI
jgi:superkiller protein 3